MTAKTRFKRAGLKPVGIHIICARIAAQLILS